MGNTQKNQEKSGSSSRRHSHRSPIVGEGFLEVGHTLQNSLLVSHLALRIQLKDQSLHLKETRGRGLPEEICMANLGRPNLLLLMGR